MIYSVVTLELTPQREGNLILFWRWFSLPFFHFRTWSSTPPVFSAEAAVFILSVLDAIVLHTQHLSSTKLTENQNPASVNMRNKTQRRCTHATWMNTEYGQLHPAPSSLTLHYLTPLGKILLQGCDLTIIYKMTQAKSTLEDTIPRRYSADVSLFQPQQRLYPELLSSSPHHLIKPAVMFLVQGVSPNQLRYFFQVCMFLICRLTSGQHFPTFFHVQTKWETVGSV